LNLDEDVSTTDEDIDVLGRLRRETLSWLALSSDGIDALLPADALDQPAAHSSRRAAAYPALSKPWRCSISMSGRVAAVALSAHCDRLHEDSHACSTGIGCAWRRRARRPVQDSEC
jgi:hypothetical protein